MKAVELEGLTDDSLSMEGSFTIKAGKGISGGKITNKYVDPKRMDKIIVGNGNGDGSGTGTGSGTAKATTTAPRKMCKSKKAKIKSRVKVPDSKYPAEAKRRGIEAEVIGILSVSATGKVTGVKIVKPAGYGFDELAKEYFMKWKFTPAEKNCVKISSQVRIINRFTLTQY